MAPGSDGALPLPIDLHGSNHSERRDGPAGRTDRAPATETDRAEWTEGRVYGASVNTGDGSRPLTPGTAGTFPAGTALAALMVWFFLGRIAVRYTLLHPGAARLSMLAGVTGAVLAAVALVVTLVQGIRAQSTLGKVLGTVRLVVALPVVSLVAAAMQGPPPEGIQWAALAGAMATVLLALGVAIVRAHGRWLTRGALATLFLGEWIELAWPPALVAAPPGSFWPTLLGRAGVLSELMAFGGSGLALAWSVTATLRVAGPERTRSYLSLPLVFGVLLSGFTAMLPPRVATAVARNALGVRFDLVSSTGGAVPAVVLLAYLFIPVSLFGAASVSLAGLPTDRGAAHRALGWLAILLAGFGAIRLAGPMDPIRMVLVALGVVLLERAVALET